MDEITVRPVPKAPSQWDFYWEKEARYKARVGQSTETLHPTPGNLFQAENRAHRKGRQRTVIYLIAKDSLKDSIWRMIKNKEASRISEKKIKSNAFTLSRIWLAIAKIKTSWIFRLAYVQMFHVPLDALQTWLVLKKNARSMSSIPFAFTLPPQLISSWSAPSAYEYCKGKGPLYANLPDLMHPNQFVSMVRVTKSSLKEIFESLYDSGPLSKNLFKIANVYTIQRRLAGYLQRRLVGRRSDSRDKPRKIAVSYVSTPLRPVNVNDEKDETRAETPPPPPPAHPSLPIGQTARLDYDRHRQPRLQHAEQRRLPNREILMPPRFHQFLNPDRVPDREARGIRFPHAMGLICIRYVHCMIIQTPIRFFIFPCRPPPPSEKFQYVLRNPKLVNHRRFALPHEHQWKRTIQLWQELAPLKKTLNPEWKRWHEKNDFAHPEQKILENAGAWYISGPRQKHSSGPFASCFCYIKVKPNASGAPVFTRISNPPAQWTTFIDNGDAHARRGFGSTFYRYANPTYDHVKIALIDLRRVLVTGRTTMWQNLPRDKQLQWVSEHTQELTRLQRRTGQTPEEFIRTRFSVIGLRPFRKDLLLLHRLSTSEFAQTQRTSSLILNGGRGFICTSATCTQNWGLRKRVITYQKGDNHEDPQNETWTLFQTLLRREELLIIEYGPCNSKTTYTRGIDLSRPSQQEASQAKSTTQIRENGKKVFEAVDGKVTKDDRDRQTPTTDAKEAIKPVPLPEGAIGYKLARYLPDYTQITVAEFFTVFPQALGYSPSSSTQIPWQWPAETLRTITDYLSGGMPYRKNDALSSFASWALAQTTTLWPMGMAATLVPKQVWRWCIVKLVIPPDARSLEPIGNDSLFASPRKMRCNKAIVVGLEEAIPDRANIPLQEGQVTTCYSAFHHPPLRYTVGKTVEVSDFEGNRQLDCAAGIHYHAIREHAFFWIDQKKPVAPQLWRTADGPPVLTQRSTQKNPPAAESAYAPALIGASARAAALDQAPPAAESASARSSMMTSTPPGASAGAAAAAAALYEKG